MPDVGRVLLGINVPGVAVEGLFDLEPIKAGNIEFGANYNNETISAQISVYQSSSKLGSRYVANPDGLFLDLVREKTRNRGLESTIEASLENGFEVGATLSLQEGRADTNDDGSLDADLDAVNISPNKLGMFVAYQADGWSGKVQYTLNMDRDFTNAADAITNQFDGYGLFDLHLSKTLDVGALQLGIQNILDKDYITYYSQSATTSSSRFFAGRGRTLTLSYKAEF